MKIYSGSANQKLAELIAKELHVPLYLPEKFIFPDREERIRVLERVVDEEIVLIQPLTPPVNEHIIEASFLVDALKRSGAKTVFLITPYLGYQRQDHIFRDGEAVSLDVVIKILEVVGVDKILMFELHSIKIPELFNIPVVHLSALPIFAKEINRLGFNDGNSVLISPDMGGIRRIKQLSEILNDMPYVSIEKDRDLATGGIEAKEIKGAQNIQLAGKRGIIVDDMISGGGTMVKASGLLKKNGIGDIYIFATHAIFSQNAPILLQESIAEKVFITDTVFVNKNKHFPKLEVLSVAPLIAEEIKKQFDF